MRACVVNDEEAYQIKDAIGKAPVGPGLLWVCATVDQ
ncbi:hypothetical protein [Photorhabdus caribbeanensis]